MGRRPKSVRQKTIEVDLERLTATNPAEAAIIKEERKKAKVHRRKNKLPVRGKRRGKYSDGPTMSSEAQPDRVPKAPAEGSKRHPERSKYPPDVDGRSVKDYPQCMRIKRNGERCKKQVVKSKDLCSVHGGKAAIKHGMCSRYTFGRLQESVDKFRNDPDLKSLKDEVALLRVLLQDNMTRFESALSNVGNDEDALASSAGMTDLIMKNVEGIRRAVMSLVQIEDGLNLRLDVTQVHAMVVQITTIVKHEVRDEETRERIVERLGSLVSPVGPRRIETLDHPGG